MEYAIVFLPLIGCLISGFFGKKLGEKNTQILTSSLVGISGILSLFIFYQVITQNYSSNKLIFNWISSGNFHVNWSIYIDPLTSLMLVIVSLISSIIHFYSIGYMSHDPHKPRFMAYLSLFTFAMLTLVTADIHPEQPSSRPFKSFVSEPGKTKKLGILRVSYKL